MGALLRLLILLLFVAVSPGKAFSGETGGRNTVTVVPFVSLEGDKEAWRGKGLADMVAQKLAETGDFDVLEHDRLQAFLKEMELQESGFADAGALQRLGGLAKADQVIYGNYTLKGSAITLHLLSMDVASQKITQQAEATGSADHLPEVAAAAVLEFLKKRGTKLSDDEIKKINFHATDSIPSLQHFYKGMDLYDQGKYEDAYGEFLAASRQDEKYLDALLWSGKMLEYTGQHEQAALTYQKLHGLAPNAVEGHDALYFAARLSEGTQPETAIRDYAVLAALMPKTPHSLEANARLAVLYEKTGHPDLAYRALQNINDFREEADKRKWSFAAARYQEDKKSFISQVKKFFGLISDNRKDLSENNTELMAGLIDLQMRQSRFFSWPHALDLYRGITMKMVSLYRAAQHLDPALKPPRGAFFIDPSNPVIPLQRYGDAKSLFFTDEKLSGDWKESFYAAIIPDGYTATGVTLGISGYVPSPSETRDFSLRVFGFPLVNNFYNNWIGTIYGQESKMSTLQKEIAFHGNNHDILTFQLMENYGKIRDWQVSFKLKKTGEEKTPAPQEAKPAYDFEGAEIARLSSNEEGLPGTSDPQYIEQYASKKRLSLVSLDSRGGWLVLSKGDLRTGQTDLWSSYSPDGKRWGPLNRMDVNSLSHDFAPQLVRAEDGSARLFWISNRRGLGWELWSSGLSPDDQWGEPQRIPLEKFMPMSNNARDALSTNLLDYAVAQDKKGQWIIAVCLPNAHGIHLLSTRTFGEWSDLGIVDSEKKFYDPTLMVDNTDTYWLGSIDGNASFQLMKSFDLKKWDRHSYALGSYSRHWSTPGNSNYGWLGQITAFPLQMFDAGDKGLTLLFSDTITGLQYSTFRPDTQQPSPDLVREISLEPYAVAKFGSAYLAAAWQGDDVVLKQYRNFALPLNGQNAASSPLYHETERDAIGNRWDRRIARTRYVMPDVTAVGAGPEGRAWWGIETGAMSLKGENFFVSDVSMGFFYHHVTDIVPCGSKTYFASSSLNKPLMGTNSSGSPSFFSGKLTIPTASGWISAISCNDNILYLGTSGGDIAALQTSAETFNYHHLETSYPTAVAGANGNIWIGTRDGRLLKIADKKISDLGLQEKEHTAAITSIATDKTGALWVATAGNGVWLLLDGKWSHFTTQNSGLPYDDIKKIKSDRGAIWLMPGLYTKAHGIGYFDGHKAALYSPPSHNIYDMIDFDLSADGSLWIGSESSGIYRFERKQQ